MSLFSAFQISGSALTAEKLRLDLIAGNLANMNSTRTAAGGPYRRRTAVFAEELAGLRMPALFSPRQGEVNFAGKGVRVETVLADHRPPQRVYDPEHPDAGPDGYVLYPNIELVKEITDMLTALRSYEANTTVLNAAKSMYLKAMEIGR